MTFVCLYFALPDTRVLNSFEELYIIVITHLRISITYMINNDNIYIYIYIYMDIYIYIYTYKHTHGHLTRCKSYEA